VPSQVPALFASLKDVGHLGTFFVLGGGRMAKAAVDLMDWKLRGDASKRALFCPVGASGAGNATAKAGSPALDADGWTLASKNGFCSVWVAWEGELGPHVSPGCI
jgi:hypothetical protein